jgi:phospholipase C
VARVEHPSGSADAGVVRKLIRFGWAIAELRGRVRVGNDDPAVPKTIHRSRKYHALPLSWERSGTEQRIELGDVVITLADELGLNPNGAHLLDYQSNPASDKDIDAANRVVQLAQAVPADPRDALWARTWNAFTEALYKWDGYIQDTLATGPFGKASAYQLGRGLAETTWALDPAAPVSDVDGWQFLLGAERCLALTQLLERLDQHFRPLVAKSVMASLRRWQELADDKDRRTPAAAVFLRTQAVLWRDFLVTDRDPKTLVAASKPFQAATIRPLLSKLRPQILLAGLSIVVLVIAAIAISLLGNNPISAATAVLGFFGITSSGLSARLKQTATGMVKTATEGIDANLVVDAITRLPPGPPGVRATPGGAPPGAALNQVTVDMVNADSAAATPPPPASLRVKHVIVLALENRSFDHLLGFLDHPDPNFDGLGDGDYTNPGWKGQPAVAATPDGKRVLPLDPDHSHDAVMEQLSAQGKGPNWHPSNQGFVTSYERKGRRLAEPTFRGPVGRLFEWLSGLLHRPSKKVKGRGPLAMRCQPPESVPVLATLARQFGVCTRWFASVPGETWPNRNFLHAATSAGETNIYPRFYTDRTIFEVLEDAGQTWHIYHDDTPQVWAFTNLWNTPERHAKWFELSDFAQHVANDQLPAYSFIEPNQRPPLHTLDHAPLIGEADVSNSQHPGNNLVSNAAYDTYSSDQPTDFSRAEQFIATVYEALRTSPAVFERSILFITHDEHGGLFDHVPPPTGVPNPGDSLHLVARFLRFLFRRSAKAFDFTMLGPRVPAIVVSPFIPAGTVSTDVRDHASVPATLRALFAPQAQPLSHRDAWSAPFHTLLTVDKDQPRTTDLPDLSGAVAGEPSAPPPTAESDQAIPARQAAKAKVPTHYKDLFVLAKKVDKRLKKQGVPEAGVPIRTPRMVKPHRVSQVFMREANRAREPSNGKPESTEASVARQAKVRK